MFRGLFTKEKNREITREKEKIKNEYRKNKNLRRLKRN